MDELTPTWKDKAVKALRVYIECSTALLSSQNPVAENETETRRKAAFHNYLSYIYKAEEAKESPMSSLELQSLIQEASRLSDQIESMWQEKISSTRIERKVISKRVEVLDKYKFAAEKPNRLVKKG